MKGLLENQPRQDCIDLHSGSCGRATQMSANVSIPGYTIPCRGATRFFLTRAVAECSGGVKAPPSSWLYPVGEGGWYLPSWLPF